MKSIHYSVAAVLLAVGVMPQAYAVETPAGTKIQNTADVTYSVGSNPQTAVKSDTVEFAVDRKVDLTVTRLSASPVEIDTGSSSTIALGNVLTYSIQNDGNDIIDVALDPTNVADNAAVPGGNDSADTANLKIYLDDPVGGTPGSWDAGDTQVDHIDSLAVGSSATVFVVADPMDNNLDDGDLVGVNLTGVAHSAYTDSTAAIGDAGHVDNGATLGAVLVEEASDTNAGVQNVFTEAEDTDGDTVSKDPAQNGQDQAYATFKVKSANISVTKVAVPYWDAFNGGDSPRALPGAVMLYCITINNALNAQTATDVTVSDTILAGQTFLGAHTFTPVTGKTTPPAITAANVIRFTDSDTCDAAAWAAAAYTEDEDATDAALDGDSDLAHSGSYDGTKVTTKVSSLAGNSNTTTMFMVTITP